MPTPKKVEDRLIAAVKHFQSILISAKAKDITESDTVFIIANILSDAFGYDKYADVTSEHAIKGTFCDLAISIESKIQFLMEVKAVGLDLKDSHVKQAVDYAANKGIDWVILSNGINWRLYKVSFSKPIDQELVLEIDFLNLNLKNEDDIDSLYILTKEGWRKQVMVDFAAQKEVLSKFLIAGVMQSEPVLNVIRRELKRVSHRSNASGADDVKVKNEQILTVLLREVLKREVVEGDKAEEAQKKIAKANARLARAQNSKQDEEVDNIVNISASNPTVPETGTQAQV